LITFKTKTMTAKAVTQIHKLIRKKMFNYQKFGLLIARKIKLNFRMKPTK
jgi:hypothetical protein